MKNNGLFWVVITTLISGVAVFANGQMVKGVDPIVLTTIKNGLVGLMVMGRIMATGKLKEVKNLSGRQWLKLCLVAVVGGSVAFGLFFTGLKIIGASEGALIHKTMVVWIVLMAIPFLKEKASPWMMAAVVGLYASNLLGGAGFKTLSPAHLMVLAATLLWSVETIMVKKYLKEMSPDMLLLGRMGIGSGFLAAYMVMSGKLALVTQITNTQWMGMVAVSVLLFGYVITWYRALKYAGAISVASILVGATVITTALSSVTTGKLTTLQLIQSLIISGIVSVILINLGTNKNLKETYVEDTREFA